MFTAFRRRLVATAICTGLTSASLPLTATADTTTLPDVNVTATHDVDTAFPGVPSTVITRADIQRLQPTSLEDLLSALPGIHIVNQGGAGKLTNVSIWGANASQTLILVDGVRIGSATAGQTYIQDLPIDLIDRIEIVRGPRSGQYGPSAMGGVIQIFTRRGQKGVHPTLSIGGGTRHRLNGSAAISGGTDHIDYSLGISHRQAAGFDSCRNSTGAPCYAIEPDQDGYRNTSAQGRIGLHGDRGERIALHWLGSRAFSDYDGSYQNQSRIRNQVFGLDGALMQLGPWQLRASAGQSRDYLTSFHNGSQVSRFDTRRNTLDLANDLHLGSLGVVTLGADQQTDHIVSSTDYTVTSRHNRGLYAQYINQFGPVSLQGSLRHDNNEQFGQANTGSVDLNWQLTPHLALTGGYGTGFRAPSFNDLYYPGFSNPDLQPERSHTARAGLNWRRGAWTSDLTAFRTRSQDLIALDSSYVPQNIASAQILGAEWQWGWRTAEWVAHGGVTWLSTRDRHTGTSLPRQPKWQARLDLDRQLGRWTLGGTWRGQTRTHEINLSRINAGYGTVDLRAGYQINRDWMLQLKVENLLDRAYQTTWGYNQAGRGAMITLRYGLND